jgi:tetratricopeptide (TPR) repeat protein
MTLENQLTIWRIVLWGAPILAGVIILIANVQIEYTKSRIDALKSEKSKNENLASEDRIRKDIADAAGKNQENFEELSDQLQKVNEQITVLPTKAELESIFHNGNFSKEEFNFIYRTALRLQLDAKYTEAVSTLINLLANNRLQVVDVALIKTEIAKSLLLSNDADNASIYLTEVNAILDQITDVGMRSEIESHVQLIFGLIEVERKNLQNALNYFKRSENLARRVGYRKGIVNALNQRSTFYVKGSNSREIILESISISDSIGYPEGKAIALMKSGVTNRDHEQFSESIKNFKESLTISQKFKKKGMIADAKMELGVIYRKINDLDMSANYLISALEIYQSRNDGKMMGYCFGNLGLIKAMEGVNRLSLDPHFDSLKPFWGVEFDKALEYHQNALKIFRNFSDIMGEANELANTGNLSMFKGDYVQSKILLQQALELHIKIGYTSSIGTDLKLLALLHLRTNEKALAILAIDDAIDAYATLQNQVQLNICYDLRSKIEEMP